MPTYKISNKKIVISPKSFGSNILVLPALVIGGALALGIRFFNFTKESSQLVSTEISDSMLAKSSDASVEIASLSMAAPAPEMVVEKVSFLSSLAGWEWFLVGIWFSSILFLLLNYRRYKNESK